MEKTVQEVVEKVANEVAMAIHKNPEAPSDPKSVFILGADFMYEQYQSFFKDFQKILAQKMSEEKAEELIKAALHDLNKNRCN